MAIIKNSERKANDASAMDTKSFAAITSSFDWETEEDRNQAKAKKIERAEKMLQNAKTAVIPVIGAYRAMPIVHFPDTAEDNSMGRLTSFGEKLGGLIYVKITLKTDKNGKEKRAHKFAKSKITLTDALNGIAEYFSYTTKTEPSSEFISAIETGMKVKFNQAANLLVDAQEHFFGTESLDGNNAKVRAAKDAVQELFNFMTEATGLPYKLIATNRDIKHLIAFSQKRRMVSINPGLGANEPGYENKLKEALINSAVYEYTITAASVRDGLFELVHHKLVKRPLPKFSKDNPGFHVVIADDDEKEMEFYANASVADLAGYALDRKQTKDRKAAAAEQDLVNKDEQGATQRVEKKISKKSTFEESADGRSVSEMIEAGDAVILL